LKTCSPRNHFSISTLCGPERQPTSAISVGKATLQAELRRKQSNNSLAQATLMTRTVQAQVQGNVTIWFKPNRKRFFREVNQKSSYCVDFAALAKQKTCC
jgi:hypothetical protein